MKPRILALAVALLCLLVLPSVALADDEPGGKIDPSVVTVLEATGGDVAVPVMVNAPGALDLVAATIPLGVVITDLPLIGSLAAFLTPDEIQALGDARFVTSIVADNLVHGFDYQSTMDVTNLTIGLGDVTAPADGGPAGAGVAVAVLDSGIATNTDLAGSRIVGWKDFVNGRPTPYDDAGHGTYVAGLIAGDGTASLPVENGGYATVQFRGVAPAASIVGIKVLDEVGQGRASAMIAGIAWAIAHKDDYNIRVLNISIGGNPVGPIRHDPIAMAVEAAWQRGITVVCAAGNEGDFGSGGILSPGNDPFVITVGATDTRQTADVSDDVVASYSSVGPTLYDEIAKPDLVAPGNRLISVRTQGSYIDSNFPDNVIPLADFAPTASVETSGTAVSNYLMLSGTSTSAPVVAGAAALMIGADPNLTPDDVKARLMTTADPVAGASANQQGAGTLDMDEALACTTQANGWALSAYLGNGKKFFKNGDYNKWEKRAWQKYGWTKFKWTKFKWTKFKWTKFKWTEVTWTKFKWTKFKWTEYDWMKFKWTTLIQGQ
ncbi:MAG: S8 family peptidase [Actinobacteria bacterium]|nr:S8 family peptidase [Actinomycetota bacterium]